VPLLLVLPMLLPLRVRLLLVLLVLPLLPLLSVPLLVLLVLLLLHSRCCCSFFLGYPVDDSRTPRCPSKTH